MLQHAWLTGLLDHRCHALARANRAHPWCCRLPSAATSNAASHLWCAAAALKRSLLPNGCCVPLPFSQAALRERGAKELPVLTAPPAGEVKEEAKVPALKLRCAASYSNWEHVSCCLGARIFLAPSLPRPFIELLPCTPICCPCSGAEKVVVETPEAVPAPAPAAPGALLRSSLCSRCFCSSGAGRWRDDLQWRRSASCAALADAAFAPPGFTARWLQVVLGSAPTPCNTPLALQPRRWLPRPSTLPPCPSPPPRLSPRLPSPPRPPWLPSPLLRLPRLPTSLVPPLTALLVSAAAEATVPGELHEGLAAMRALSASRLEHAVACNSMCWTVLVVHYGICTSGCQTAPAHLCRFPAADNKTLLVGGAVAAVAIAAVAASANQGGAEGATAGAPAAAAPAAPATPAAGELGVERCCARALVPSRCICAIAAADVTAVADITAAARCQASDNYCGALLSSPDHALPSGPPYCYTAGGSQPELDNVAEARAWIAAWRAKQQK